MLKSGEKKKVLLKEQSLFHGTENQTDGSLCHLQRQKQEVDIHTPEHQRIA